MLVSVGTTALSATVLAVLVVGLGWAAGVASVVANVCGIGPSYWFNRRFAWRRRGAGDLRREALPFWTLSLAGMALSAVAVSVAAGLTGSLPPEVRAAALPLANASAFAVLWVVQFVVLDRWVFRSDRRQCAAAASARAARRATGATSIRPASAQAPATTKATW